MHVNPAGAVRLAELKLFTAFVHVEQMGHHRPAQPIRGLLPDIHQPPVIAADQGVFDFRRRGPCPQKHGRVEHLHIDAKLIHVFEAALDVFHLARALGGVGADIAFLGQHAIVHEPEFPLGEPHLARHRAGGVLGLDHQRPVFFKLRV